MRLFFHSLVRRYGIFLVLVSASALIFTACSKDSASGRNNNSYTDGNAPGDPPNCAVDGVPAEEICGCDSLEGLNGKAYSLDSDPNESVSVTSNELVLSTSNESSKLIWISEHDTQTIAKIDSSTQQVLARYHVGGVYPSRTAVDAWGNAYVTGRPAVAGANGAYVTKIASHDIFCKDKNGNGLIETSRGPSEVLPFGQDECVLWHQPPSAFPGATDLRGVVVETRGTLDGSETYVWVGSLNAEKIWRLNADTGAVQLETPVGCAVYGLAIGKGNLWASCRGANFGILRLDTAQCTPSQCDPTVHHESLNTINYAHDSKTKQFIPYGSKNSPYGITVDKDGYVWTGSHPYDGVIIRPDGSHPVAGHPRRYQHRMPTGQQRFVEVGAHLDVRGITASEDFVYGVLIRHDNPASPGEATSHSIIQIDRRNPASYVEMLGLRTSAEAYYGVAIDHRNRVWGIGRNNTATVIDVSGFNNIASTSLMTGMQGRPYVYSDFTGRQSSEATQPFGTYSHVFEAKLDDHPWVSFDIDLSLPSGTSALVHVRTANTREDLNDSLPWALVANYPDEDVLNEAIEIRSKLESHGMDGGKFLEVRMTLQTEHVQTLTKGDTSPVIRGITPGYLCRTGMVQ